MPKITSLDPRRPAKGQREENENKLKLRKAMADATLTDELEKQETQTLESVARRQKLESAVKNDDWSSIIESQ